MTPFDEGRFDDLVFARIASGAKPPPPSAIVTSLQVVLSTAHDKPGLTAAVAAAIARLIGAKAIDKKRNVLKRRALDGLGAVGEGSWRQLRSWTLPALALGLDGAVPKTRLKGEGGWAAAILGRATKAWKNGLPPTLAKLGDALAAKQPAQRIPRATGAARIKAIKEALALKEPSGKTVERQAGDLARQVLAWGGSTPTTLQSGLVWRWLRKETWTQPLAVVPPPSPDFATEVRSAAARATSVGPRSRKVFISAVWRDPAFKGISLDEFKRRLVDAHKAGTVVLERADRAGGLDAALLKESETPHLDSRYHFVESGGAP